MPGSAEAEHILGQQLSLAFSWPEDGFTFTGKSLLLFFDHCNQRLSFTETGVTKTVSGVTTTIDSTPVEITDDGQRIAWYRNSTFATTHLPAGKHVGYLMVGDTSTSRDAFAKITLSVVLPKGGAS